MKTLGLACNFYNESAALPGFLETHAPFFDHITFYEAGPGGARSNDGSREIIEAWKFPIHAGNIDDGFGIVRTAAIRSSPCDYVMLLDADERFYHTICSLHCAGEGTPHDQVSKALYDYGVDLNFDGVAKLGEGLTVTRGEAYSQGAWLKAIVQHGSLDGVVSVRRHWHDFSFARPTQNWEHHNDRQCRILRNDPSIYYDPNVKMHERLVGASNLYHPNLEHGPFFDHFHFFFKRMKPSGRAHANAIYNALNGGIKPPTLEEFSAAKGGAQ